MQATVVQDERLRARGARGDRVSCPVDVVYDAVGVRARHLPGEVDLAARVAFAPPFMLGEPLRVALEETLAGDPTGLVPLKVRIGDATVGACACGGEQRAALVDLALGPALGFVIERLQAPFCTGCSRLHFDGDGTAVRQRILDWNRLDPAARTEPSLRYETDRHPRTVQIEVTTRCNLSCRYCAHSRLPQHADMTDADFEDVLAAIDFDEVDCVDFTGLGEAALHPRLGEMIRAVAARAPEASLRIVSNAVSASAEQWRALVEAGLESIAFSVDTLDEERFRRQRGGGSLAKARRIVEGVAALRRSGTTRDFALRIKAVLLSDPWGEAERLLAWSHEHGLDRPQFATLDPREVAAPLYRGVDWLTDAFDNGAAQRMFDAWVVERWCAVGGRDAPARRPLALRYRHPSLDRDETLCRWARDATFVTGDGRLLTCCESMIDVPRAAVGSVRRRPLVEAWGDDLLWSYRLPLSLGLLPAGCVGCSYAPPAGRPLP